MTHSYMMKNNGERKTYKCRRVKQEMNGKLKHLHLFRERHSFGDGDLQRNRNQVKVLKALSSKSTFNINDYKHRLNP
ncbi:MAG: LCP family protein [Eubacterium sp.]